MVDKHKGILIRRRELKPQSGYFKRSLGVMAFQRGVVGDTPLSVIPISGEHSSRHELDSQIPNTDPKNVTCGVMPADGHPAHAHEHRKSVSRSYGEVFSRRK